MNTDASAFSPGLKGVLAGETSLARVDGENGRLVYRGYPIGELVERGSYAAVAELLWTDDWNPEAHLACAPLPDGVLEVLRRLPPGTNAMDALRSAFRAYFAFKAEHPGKVKKPYLYFVDYGLDSREPRGYVFDMDALQIVEGPFTVAHGRGSLRARDGVPTRFTNIQNSATSSLTVASPYLVYSSIPSRY